MVLWEYLRTKVVQKYNGYGKFAKNLATGVTIVLWKSKNIPPEFRLDWDRMNATRGLPICVSLVLTLALTLMLNA
jgi:hypothetical protein